MNDQWSGKILLSAVRTQREAAKRASNQRAVAATGDFISSLVASTVPEARPHRLGIAAAGPEEALLVERDGQLGQGPGGRAEGRLAAREHVERRLVAGAEELPALVLVEPHRAAG